jgi:DUF4097 and DUF4098 domain-containing protein YvlB
MSSLHKSWTLISGLVLSLSIVCTSALARETVNQTLAADASGFVEIKHVSGEARIIGWDSNEVKVEGLLGERTDSFRFERNGKRIIIEVEVPNSKGWWSNSDSGKGDDLVIHVPKASRIDYNSPNAKVSVENISGGADISVVNGQLRAEDLKGRIRLSSVNGDIRGIRLAGEVVLDTVNGDINAEQTLGDEITAKTVNGDIEVTASASEVTAEAVNGDIEFFLAEVEVVNTNTVNGSIQMEMSLAEGANVRASSVGGSIELAFQKDVQAGFDIESHSGGRIKNRITDEAAQKPKYGPRRWLEFSTGNANATVEISTVHGRIEVKTK